MRQKKNSLAFPKNLPFLYVTLAPTSYISSGIFCLSSFLDAIIFNENSKRAMNKLMVLISSAHFPQTTKLF